MKQSKKTEERSGCQLTLGNQNNPEKQVKENQFTESAKTEQPLPKLYGELKMYPE